MNRLNKLQEVLKTKNLDGFLVTNFYNIRYLIGFVGLTPQEREAYVVVTPDEVFFFTDGRYLEQAKKLQMEIGEWKLEGGKWKILEIKPGEKIAKLISNLTVELKIKRLGIEKNDLRISEYEELKKYLERHARVYQICYTENLVEDLRAQKEEGELEKIEKAVKIADKCFTHLLEFIKPGLTEKEVADEIEWFISREIPRLERGLVAASEAPRLRKEGAIDISFDPIVASGENSVLPHYLTGSCKLKTGDLVLIDFGAKVEGYCSDITRVIFLGKPTTEQKKIYKFVLEAQKRTLDSLSNVKEPKAWDIDKVARDYLKSRGFKLIHGLGHGVGLSEHETPRLGPSSRDILKEGMVFSLEPGVYLPGNFGIRIEDLVVLEKEGPRVLTKATKEIVTV